jgi:hypothetical protein
MQRCAAAAAAAALSRNAIFRVMEHHGRQKSSAVLTTNRSLDTAKVFKLITRLTNFLAEVSSAPSMQPT